MLELQTCEIYTHNCNCVTRNDGFKEKKRDYVVREWESAKICIHNVGGNRQIVVLYTDGAPCVLHLSLYNIIDANNMKRAYFLCFALCLFCLW